MYVFAWLSWMSRHDLCACSVRASRSRRDSRAALHVDLRAGRPGLLPRLCSPRPHGEGRLQAQEALAARFSTATGARCVIRIYCRYPLTSARIALIAPSCWSTCAWRRARSCAAAARASATRRRARRARRPRRRAPPPSRRARAARRPLGLERARALVGGRARLERAPPHQRERRRRGRARLLRVAQLGRERALARRRRRAELPPPLAAAAPRPAACAAASAAASECETSAFDGVLARTSPSARRARSARSTATGSALSGVSAAAASSRSPRVVVRRLLPAPQRRSARRRRRPWRAMQCVVWRGCAARERRGRPADSSATERSATAVPSVPVIRVDARSSASQGAREPPGLSAPRAGDLRRRRGALRAPARYRARRLGALVRSCRPCQTCRVARRAMTHDGLSARDRAATDGPNVTYMTASRSRRSHLGPRRPGLRRRKRFSDALP